MASAVSSFWMVFFDLLILSALLLLVDAVAVASTDDCPGNLTLMVLLLLLLLSVFRVDLTARRFLRVLYRLVSAVSKSQGKNQSIKGV